MLASDILNNSSVLRGSVTPGAGYLDTYSNVSSYDPNLSLLEKAWAAYFVWMQNDVAAMGIMLFVMHELVYFGRSLPWFIIDLIPWFRRYKIQQDRQVDFGQQWECLKGLLLSHFTVEALPMAATYHICGYLGIQNDVPFPSWGKIAFQCAVFLVMEDAWFYWSHRFLHYGVFYKYIHKQHHRYAAPFGFAAEYAHPIEVVAFGIGTFGMPFLWAAATGDLHMFTVYVWLHIRLFQAIDAHSGYDFPWSLHNFVPFWAGADHHDDHHRYFIGNYASSFRYWDHLCGTFRERSKSDPAGVKKNK
jgi:methylsterol monooxygenase